MIDKNIFDIICLWIGRSIVFILLIILIGIFIYFFGFFCIPLRRPWYCIKRLMPWKWILIEEYKKYKRICFLASKHSEKYEDWKIGIKVNRKGRFGNLIIPNKKYWWEPKNHFFIIKKI